MGIIRLEVGGERDAGGACGRRSDMIPMRLMRRATKKLGGKERRR